MRVCLVSQDYPPETARGGISTQTLNKARALARLGHEVTVLSKSNSGASSRTVSPEGITVHRMRPPAADFPVYSPSAYWLGYSWCVLAGIHELLQTGLFDILDFAEYGAEGFAYQVDRTIWNWIPVVVQLHGPLAMCSERLGWPEIETEFYRIGTFLEGTSIRLADHLTACSRNIAAFTAGWYGVPADCIEVVHCGVDAERFCPGQNDLDDDGRPTVLFAGNVARNKGVEIVLEAVLRLRAKYPGIRLQVVGPTDSGLVHELTARASEAAEDRILEIHGFVGQDRLAEYYRCADVFASPASHENGVANVYLEAMACGCPVVASSAGGGPEAVEDGETGWIVPPNDPGATAEALDRLLSNRAMRRSMGVAARRRIEEYFAMDRYIERVLRSYERAIEQSRRKFRLIESQMAAGSAGEKP